PLQCFSVTPYSMGIRCDATSGHCRLLGIGSLTHAIDGVIGGQHGMSDKLVIDYRRLVAITPYRMPRSSGCVLDDCNLETLFDKVAQMGLDAHIRQHATEYDLRICPEIIESTFERVKYGFT